MGEEGREAKSESSLLNEENKRRVETKFGSQNKVKVEKRKEANKSRVKGEKWWGTMRSVKRRRISKMPERQINIEIDSEGAQSQQGMENESGINTKWENNQRISRLERIERWKSGVTYRILHIISIVCAFLRLFLLLSFSLCVYPIPTVFFGALALFYCSTKWYYWYMCAIIDLIRIDRLSWLIHAVDSDITSHILTAGERIWHNLFRLILKSISHKPMRDSHNNMNSYNISSFQLTIDWLKPAPKERIRIMFAKQLFDFQFPIAYIII